jgi:hypothetical protein
MANFQLGDTEKAPYTVVVLDGASNPATLQPGDTVTVTSQDVASVTVVPDATPVAGSVASGFIVGGKKVQPNVVITATATLAASENPLPPATAMVDVVGGVASSISLGFGAPVAQ